MYMQIFICHFFRFFRSLSCAISTTIMLCLWSTAKHTHSLSLSLTHTNTRPAQNYCSSYCVCVRVCIAASRTWRNSRRWHCGTTARWKTEKKKADENETDEEEEEEERKKRRRTGQSLAVHSWTHTLTGDETRENVFFILIFKKGTPFVIYVQAHNSSAVITWMAQRKEKSREKRRRRACMRKENFNERFSC